MVFAVMACTMLLFSCGTGQSSSNEKLMANDVKDEIRIPDGWALGKGKEFVPATKAEQNLVSQQDTYQSALFHGNTEEMKYYFYKECLPYYQKYFPGYSIDEILNEFLESLSSDATKMIQACSEKGLNISMYIEDVVREVEYGSDYLYVYNICSRMEGVKKNTDTITYLHSTEPDLTLAISHNKGKNWTFMAMTNEVPSILRMYYPQEIINKVMGY